MSEGAAGRGPVWATTTDGHGRTASLRATAETAAPLIRCPCMAGGRRRRRRRPRDADGSPAAGNGTASPRAGRRCPETACRPGVTNGCYELLPGSSSAMFMFLGMRTYPTTDVKCESIHTLPTPFCCKCIAMPLCNTCMRLRTF